MKRILVTGGTVFVSRYVAEYYVRKGCQVYTLNRNSRTQPRGAFLIQADRHRLSHQLRHFDFDAVLDITAYTPEDVNDLLNALGEYKDYILLSSSAVYPEYIPQPFSEEAPLGKNRFWGAYGLNKIAAEEALLRRNPKAYILRPPYLYGQMNNLYREAFAFDCALKERKFYLPQEGQMQLQFFHVEDLCRFIDIILQKKPDQHIFNLGNKETVSIRDWVKLCYEIVGKQVEFVHVPKGPEQRSYFCFHDYEYALDIQKQQRQMPVTKPIEEGLKASLEWYLAHPEEVNKKPLMDYIDGNL